jgi:hypothetical protein
MGLTTMSVVWLSMFKSASLHQYNKNVAIKTRIFIFHRYPCFY